MVSSQKTVPDIEMDKEEHMRMLKFVKQNAESTGSRLDMLKMWQNYVDAYGLKERAAHYDIQFRIQLAPKIYKLPMLDRLQKVRILFTTGTPVHEQFLAVLRKEAYVQVTEDNVMFYYKEKKENGFRLPVSTKKAAAVVKTEPVNVSESGRRVSMFYTEAEDTEILDFVAEKATAAKTVVSMRRVWMEYKTTFGSQRQCKSLHARFRSILGPSIHLSTRYDTRTKVRMLHASSTPVNAGFLEELRKGADVGVDEKGLILYYKEYGQPMREAPKKPVDPLDFLNFIAKQESLEEGAGMFQPNPDCRGREEEGNCFNPEIVKEEPIDEFVGEEVVEDVKPSMEELRRWAETVNGHSSGD